MDFEKGKKIWKLEEQEWWQKYNAAIWEEMKNKQAASSSTPSSVSSGSAAFDWCPNGSAPMTSGQPVHSGMAYPDSMIYKGSGLVSDSGKNQNTGSGSGSGILSYGIRLI